MTRYTAQVPQIGANVQIRPISDGAARQSSTSGQFSSGGGADMSPSSVYDTPPHDGSGDRNAANLVHVDRHHVPTEDGQVGVESFADATAVRLGEFRPGRAGSVRVQGFVPAEALLRHPGLTLVRLARDRRAQALPGIDLLNGEIAAEGERRPGVERLPPVVLGAMPLRAIHKHPFRPGGAAG